MYAVPSGVRLNLSEKVYDSGPIPLTIEVIHDRSHKLSDIFCHINIKNAEVLSWLAKCGHCARGNKPLEA